MISALHALTESQLFDWLRLIRSENIGPRTFKGLLDRYGEAAAALRALPDLIRRNPASRRVKICPEAEAQDEWNRAKRLGIRFVALCEPTYPAPLRAIDAPPPLLAVLGDVAVLQQPAVAIVGSRNASASGLIFTERLARGLGLGGYVVASGLARGIDAKAHVASLDTGTIAVLAGGHERVYPSEHEALSRRILAKGALVSEMPLAWEPRARDFPRRNRIVAGLGLGVVVVEASRRSGSLITARFANEQGREVFAVPGSPLDARSEGTNDLLRQGATMCTSADDVLNALAALRDGSPAPDLREPQDDIPEAEPLWEEAELFSDPDLPAEGFKSAQSHQAAYQAEPPQACPGGPDRLLELIGPVPVLIDELIRAAGMTPRAVQAALIELELAGCVRRYDGNRIARDLGTPLPETVSD